MDEKVILLDEASIRFVLKEEEKLDLEVNKMMQSINEEVAINEIVRDIEAEVASKDLNTLLQRYAMVLNEKDSTVHCQVKNCKSFKFDKDKIYLIRNHWETHHGPKNMIYDQVRNDQFILKILQKYKITDGTLATCSVVDCTYSTNLEEDTQLSHDELTSMHEHWMKDHWYETNIFQTYQNGQKLITFYLFISINSL